MDPANPTCPAQPNWSDYPTMRFTYEVVGGLRVLKAEGRIDRDAPAHLQEALDDHPDAIDEIWFRSPGGDAQAGNQAGYMIRQSTIPTRIPAGWTCFSACNFMFMGGMGRTVDPGGVFMVHMFTHLANRDAIRREIAAGEDRTVRLIGDIEQDSAVLASEDADFLVRMGIPSRLLHELMYQQPAVAGSRSSPTRRCLTQQELVEYNVAAPIAWER